MTPRAATYTAADVAGVRELAADHPLAWAMHASGWSRDRRTGLFRPRYEVAPHLKYLGKHLMRIHRGECKRLLVSMPPRFGKTLLTSRFFLGWWLGKHPDHRVITTTYQARLVQRWSRNVRNDLVRCGPEVFGVAASARAAGDDWDLLPMRPRREDEPPVEGGMSAVGTQGALTGKGAQILNCDDLVKGSEEVRNAQVRENMWDWFEADLMTRLEPDGAALVTMTRWHDDDIPGRIIRSQAEGRPVGGEPWEVINLPALALAEDPLGRAPGESLWESRWPRAKLERMRAGMRADHWESLFQGSPVQAAGNIFKRANFVYYHVTGPAGGGYRADGFKPDDLLAGPGFSVEAKRLLVYVTVDPAWTTTTRSDHTVIAAWGLEPVSRNLFMLDLARGRLEPHEVGPAMLKMMHRWKTRVAYVERSNFHSDEAATVRSSGVPMFEIQPQSDKVARALPAATFQAQGRLFFPAGAPWLRAYEEELLTFPQGAADDQVDATSYGVNAAGQVLFYIAGAAPSEAGHRIIVR